MRLQKIAGTKMQQRIKKEKISILLKKITWQVFMMYSALVNTNFNNLEFIDKEVEVEPN